MAPDPARRPRPFGVPPRVAWWIVLVYQLATTALLASAATRHAWGQVTFYGCLTVAGLSLVVLLTGVLILDELPARGWVKAPTPATEARQPQTWGADQRIRHTGTFELGTVTAVDFDEDLVQIEDGRWWRMEHVIEVQRDQ